MHGKLFALALPRLERTFFAVQNHPHSVPYITPTLGCHRAVFLYVTKHLIEARTCTQGV
jgi:hypothetical protein